MDIYVVLLFIVLLVLFLAYFLVDVNYFIRAGYTLLVAQFFRKRIKFMDTSVIYGIVLPKDADTWLTHMNNARFLREFDFGRLDHITRTGFIGALLRLNGGGVLAAQTIRYRRALHMFSVYKIITTPVYFDAKSIYFEHKIVTLNDNITRCVSYNRLVFTIELERLITKQYPDVVKPPLATDLQHWIEYNNLSSERLKSFRSRNQSPESGKLLSENEAEFIKNEED